MLTVCTVLTAEW